MNRSTQTEHPVEGGVGSFKRCSTVALLLEIIMYIVHRVLTVHVIESERLDMTTQTSDSL